MGQRSEKHRACQAAGQKVTPTPPPKAPAKRESVTRRVGLGAGMVCAKGWRITVTQNGSLGYQNFSNFTGGFE